MFLLILVYVAALAAGVVASNLARVGYGMLTRDALGFRHLIMPGFFQPLRALAVVAAGPVLVLRWGLAHGRAHTAAGGAAIAASFVWSFLEGVVILTQCFGVT
jgi:hypothetical protein